MIPAWLAGLSAARLVVAGSAIAALLAGVAAWHLTAVNAAREAGRAEARLEDAENRAEINRLSARASEAARAEEHRRADAQRIADEQTAAELQALRAAAARVRQLDRRVRDLQAAHAAAARRTAADPAASAECKTAARAAVVYAELFRLADEAAGRMARTAAERGIAGSSCERRYDALTPSKGALGGSGPVSR